LGGADPLNAIDTTICMGAAASMGHGAQKVFTKFGENMRTVGVMGDSTFFHTGMNSLLNAAYNKSNTITVILDNRITGMTGHQENPGTGFTLQGALTKIVDIPELVKALGIDHLRVVSPINLQEVREALDWAYSLEEPSVIITRWPCVLKKQSEKDKNEFGNYMGTCKVDEEKCIGCKMCVKTGCPALSFNKETKKVKIDVGQCVACKVCAQVCPKKAINKVGE
jgi:indolepyruvate ferredoxin oxidoreductase alpha subunit